MAKPESTSLEKAVSSSLFFQGSQHRSAGRQFRFSMNITYPQWFYFVLFAALSVAFSLAALYILGANGSSVLTNSDMIMPFMVVNDLFADPSSLLDWDLSPALYVFPDWIITAALLVTPFSKQIIPVGFPGVMMAGLSFVSGYIINRVLSCGFATATLAVSLILLLVYSASIGASTFADLTQQYIGIQYIHSGALLFGVMILATLISDFGGPNERLWTKGRVLGCILSFTGCYSDPLLLPWFIAPGVAVVCLAYIINKLWLQCLMILTLPVTAVAGLVLDKATRTFPTNIPSNHSTSINVWTDLLISSANQAKPIFLVAVLLCLAMAVRGAFLISRVIKTQSMSPPDLAEVLLIGCSWAALLLPFAWGALIHPSLIRYSLPIYLIPYIWIVLIGLRYSPASIGLFFPIVCCAVWIALGVVMWSQILSSVRTISKGNKDLVSCLLNSGLSDGYADYWRSKATIWESNYRLHVVQLSSDLKAQSFNFNRRWFTERAISREPFRPTFIILVAQKFAPDEVAEKFGVPNRKIECSGWPVWIYDTPLSVVSVGK
jgi:hypothetical protein